MRLLKEFLIQLQFQIYLNNYLDYLLTWVKKLCFMNSLDANIRNNSTKGQLNAIRNNGDVPGIIYGGKDQNQKISISKKSLKVLIEKDPIPELASTTVIIPLASIGE